MSRGAWMRSFAEQSCRGVDTAFSDCSSSWRSRRRERFKRVASLEVVDVDVSSRLVGVDSGARAGRGGEPSAAEPTGGSRGIRRLWLAAPTTDLPSIGRDQVADPVPVTPSPRHAVARPRRPRSLDALTCHLVRLCTLCGLMHRLDNRSESVTDETQCST